MESFEHKSPNISLPNCNKMQSDFWQVGIFNHALSKYKYDYFKNSNICGIRLKCSMRVLHGEDFIT